MASSRPGISSSSSRRKRNNAARIIAQTAVDAKNAAEFEEQGSSFDYAQAVLPSHEVNWYPEPRGTTDKVTAYLQHIKKAKLIQPFGCLIAIDEESFKIMAYSENAPEMLTMDSHAVPALSESPTLGIGTDMRTIFTSTSAAALQKALGYNEVSLLNPILVHCKTSGKPFYAIIHRITGCLIFDFEPVKPSEIPTSTTASGALQSYKLAAKAIARLQSLPGGSMGRLCEALMEEVFQLTGYDRVMVYKFHEDDHGEVYREITKPGMEPYLGLHYPATDIPQAARFLFIKNKVRMICDCRAKSVNINQDETLPFDITFCGSTLRAAHDCHLRYMANMNTIASLAMAVIVNDGEEDDDHLEPGQSSQQQRRPWQQRRKNLWGLVVFSVHVTKELELENQIREKNISRTQTLLCDMLLRDTAPVGIITQNPNLMDLVKCDGAALLYDDRIWRLGLTPTKEQIRSIAHWVAEHHMAPTALSTDSLQDAGYPAAQALGDVVCGMAAAWITSKDILFWFRSHAAAEIRWAGAKHEPDDKDDGTKMHPRSSFKAFLQVNKTKSLPWKDFEMDAIHSLQLILRGTFNNTRTSVTRRPSPSSPDASKPENIMELQTVTNEMVRLIETANAPILAPILAADVNGLISGWNPKIAQVFLQMTPWGSICLSLWKSLQWPARRAKGRISDENPRCSERGWSCCVGCERLASHDMNGRIAGACFVAQDMTDHKLVMDKFIRIQGAYKAIIHNPSPLIPPIFSADVFGWCSEWNTAMAKLSG
ncbi:putative phytochrome, GAF domain, phytochrome, central region, GAF-like domain superfamily [Dioscorea sansibarensis]